MLVVYHCVITTRGKLAGVLVYSEIVCLEYSLFYVSDPLFVLLLINVAFLDAIIV